MGLLSSAGAMLPAGLLLAKATLIVAAAAGAALLLRGASAEARHHLWLGALVLLLALPAAVRILPVTAVLPAWSGSPAGSPARGEGPSDLPSAAAARVEAPAPAVRAALVEGTGAPVGAEGGGRAGVPLDLVTLLAGLWALGAAVVLGRLGWSAVVLRRILRSARAPGDAGWRRALWEAADRLGLEEAPELVVSGRTAMPFTCGVLRPVIVLPEAAAEWSEGRRRAVLFHELAHIRRRDLLGHTVGRVACGLYWFHPLVWLAARRLRAESERACDDLVLGVGTRPSEYADHLLQIVTGVRERAAAPAVALPMARRREFEGRMLAILDPHVPRGAARGSRVLVLGGGLLAASLFVATLAPARPAPAPVTARQGAGQGALPEQSARRRAPATVPAASDPGRPFDFTLGGVRTSLRLAPRSASGDSARDVPTLLRLLASDPDASVRRTAAWGLAGAASAVPGLTRALEHDADAQVRETAAWALGQGEPAAGGAALVRAARSDASPEVRRTGVWAIGNLVLKDRDALEVVTAALTDRDEGIRYRAAWALGRLAPEHAPAALERALADPGENVRLAAAWAAGEIRDPALADALWKRAGVEADDRVRRALVRAVLLLATDSPERLHELLASSDPAVREGAARVLSGADDALAPWPWPWPEPRPYP